MHQGLAQLDRFIASTMLTEVNFKLPNHGVHFSTYARYCCQANFQPVSGRALIAIVCMNFRVDRNEIATMTRMRLQSIQLQGWGMAAVANFMNEVDMVMQEIDPDVLDLMQGFLFEWLMIHIRDWKPLEAKMEEVQESMPGSEQRTFSYLWSIMRKKIANSTEGVNRAAVIAS